MFQSLKLNLNQSINKYNFLMLKIKKKFFTGMKKKYINNIIISLNIIIRMQKRNLLPQLEKSEKMYVTYNCFEQKF